MYLPSWESKTQRASRLKYSACLLTSPKQDNINYRTHFSNAYVQITDAFPCSKPLLPTSPTQNSANQHTPVVWNTPHVVSPCQRKTTSYLFENSSCRLTSPKQDSANRHMRKGWNTLHNTKTGYCKIITSWFVLQYLSFCQSKSESSQTIRCTSRLKHRFLFSHLANAKTLQITTCIWCTNTPMHLFLFHHLADAKHCKSPHAFAAQTDWNIAFCFLTSPMQNNAHHHTQLAAQADWNIAFCFLTSPIQNIANHHMHLLHKQIQTSFPVSSPCQCKKMRITARNFFHRDMHKRLMGFPGLNFLILTLPKQNSVNPHVLIFLMLSHLANARQCESPHAICFTGTCTNSGMMVGKASAALDVVSRPRQLSSLFPNEYTLWKDRKKKYVWKRHG